MTHRLLTLALVAPWLACTAGWAWWVAVHRLAEPFWDY